MRESHVSSRWNRRDGNLFARTIWIGSDIAAYGAAKARIFENQTPPTSRDSTSHDVRRLCSRWRRRGRGDRQRQFSLATDTIQQRQPSSRTAGSSNRRREPRGAGWWPLDGSPRCAGPAPLHDRAGRTPGGRSAGDAFRRRPAPAEMTRGRVEAFRGHSSTRWAVADIWGVAVRQRLEGRPRRRVGDAFEFEKLRSQNVVETSGAGRFKGAGASGCMRAPLRAVPGVVAIGESRPAALPEDIGYVSGGREAGELLLSWGALTARFFARARRSWRSRECACCSRPLRELRHVPRLPLERGRRCSRRRVKGFLS